MPSRSRLPEWPKAGEQLEAVEQAGGDSARFSGISAFKGGIYRDVAIEAHVDEAILYLHAATRQTAGASGLSRSGTDNSENHDREQNKGR